MNIANSAAILARCQKIKPTSLGCQIDNLIHSEVLAYKVIFKALTPWDSFFKTYLFKTLVLTTSPTGLQH